MSRRESFVLGGIVFLLIGMGGIFLFKSGSDHDESVAAMFAVLQSVSVVFFVFAGHFFWSAYKMKDRRPKSGG